MHGPCDAPWAMAQIADHAPGGAVYPAAPPPPSRSANQLVRGVSSCPRSAIATAAARRFVPHPGARRSTGQVKRSGHLHAPSQSLARTIPPPITMRSRAEALQPLRNAFVGRSPSIAILCRSGIRARAHRSARRAPVGIDGARPDGPPAKDQTTRRMAAPTRGGSADQTRHRFGSRRALGAAAVSDQAPRITGHWVRGCRRGSSPPQTCPQRSLRGVGTPEEMRASDPRRKATTIWWA